MGLNSERHIEIDRDAPPSGIIASRRFAEVLRQAAKAVRARSLTSQPPWETALPSELAAVRANPAPTHGAPKQLWTRKLRPGNHAPMVVVFAVDETRQRVYILHAYLERLLTTRADRQIAHDRAAERLRDYYPGFTGEPEWNP